jgi:hypothetical protein
MLRWVGLAFGLNDFDENKNRTLSAAPQSGQILALRDNGPAPTLVARGEGSNVSAGTPEQGDTSPNSVGRSADRVALQMLGHSAELLRHFDERRFRKNLVGLPRQL